MGTCSMFRDERGCAMGRIVTCEDNTLREKNGGNGSGGQDGMRAKLCAGIEMDDFAGVLHSICEGDPISSELVQGYERVLGLCKSTHKDVLDRGLCKEMTMLCKCLQRDISHYDEKIAASAVGVLGFVLDRTSFTRILPDEEATDFVQELCITIVGSTSKQICRFGLWCLSIQKLKPCVLALNVNLIVNAVTHGLQNPFGSLSIISESFQVLIHFTKLLPAEMRNLSWSWAPPACSKLIDSNAKIADLAQNSILEMEHVLVPPVPKLSEVLLVDMQQRLFAKLDGMIKLDGRPTCIAVRAWGWFVKLLGSNFVRDNSVTNMMLRVLETSFTNPSSQVRNACQIAWMSAVDAFLPSTVDPTVSGNSETLGTISAAYMNRLNVLLVPFLEVMRCEKQPVVQQSCCRTWLYMLCKLGSIVNDKEIFEVAVSPMLHLIFGYCRSDRDRSVWEACVHLLADALSCNKMSENSFGDESVGSKKTSFQSPKIPVSIDYTEVLSNSHCKNIQWSPLDLDRLRCTLQLLDVIWKAGLKLQESAGELTEGQRGCSSRRHFEVVQTCWKLLVEGVEAEGRHLVRPPGRHVAAVHMLLESMSAMFVVEKPTDGLLSFTWTLAEILIDGLGNAIVASSYYRKRVEFTSPTFFMVDDNGERDDPQLSESPVSDTVTPVVFIVASWLKFFVGGRSKGTENFWMRAIDKLVATGRTCFDVMGHYHGFAGILNDLARSSCVHRGDSALTKAGKLSESLKPALSASDIDMLLSIWMAFVGVIKEQIANANDVPAVGGCHRDSGYHVMLTILLFPVKWSLLSSVQEDRVSQSDSLHHFQRVQDHWFAFFDVILRISSLKCSQQNALISGLFNRVSHVMKWCNLQDVPQQLSSTENGSERCFERTAVPLNFLGFLVDILVHAVKHTDVWNQAMLAITRKRRKSGFGGSSARVHSIGGMELEDTNNLNDVFSTTEMLLILLREQCMSNEPDGSPNDPTIRLFGALTDLMQQITSQSDSIMLLQALANPFASWLAVDCDGNGVRHGTHLSDSLLESLTRAWDSFLSCLENCRPHPVFDSILLGAQAPCLAAAFMHHRCAISNRTLAFWEKTYAAKSVGLKYPPSLQTVFYTLRQKINIYLPGWNFQSGETAQDSPKLHYVSNVKEESFKRQLKKAGRHLGGRIQSMMDAANQWTTRIEHISCSTASQESVLGSSKGVAVDDLRHISDQVDSSGPCTLNSSVTMPSADRREWSVNRASVEFQERDVKFLSTPVGNAVIDALVNASCSTTPQKFSQENSEDDVSNSGKLEDLQLVVDLGPEQKDVIDSTSLAAECPSTSKDDDSTRTDRGAASEDHPIRGVDIFPSAANEDSSPPEGAQDGTQASNHIVPSVPRGATPMLVTPSIASIAIPFNPPKMLLPTERSQGTERLDSPADASPEQPPILLGESSKDSGAVRRKRGRPRKMLNFQDKCEDVKDAVSPHRQTKHENLTKRRKMGRCTVGVRTRAKECEARHCNDSLSGKELNPTDAQGSNDDNCKENVPPELPRHSRSTAQADTLPARRRSPRTRHLGSPVSDSKSPDTHDIDKEKYVDLKRQLYAALQSDPSLKFRQIAAQEQFGHLSKPVTNRLSSLCSRFRRRHADSDKSSPGRPEDFCEVIESREGHNFEFQQGSSAAEEKVAVLSSCAVKRKAKSQASPCRNPEESIESKDGPGFEIYRRSLLAVAEIGRPSPWAVKRKAQPEDSGNGEASGKEAPLILRSGKLLGGHRWKLTSNSGTVIAARLGFKKILAKKQKIYGSNAELKPDAGTQCDVVDKNVAERQLNVTALRVMSLGVQTRSRARETTLMTTVDQNKRISKALPNPLQKEISSSFVMARPECQITPPDTTPFQVRTLNRGWLANAYSEGAAPYRTLSESCKKGFESKQRTSVSSRAADHNPRKIRVPRRVPSAENSNAIEHTDLHRNTVTASDTCAETDDLVSTQAKVYLKTNVAFCTGAEPSSLVPSEILGIGAKSPGKSHCNVRADNEDEQTIRSCFLESSRQHSTPAAVSRYFLAGGDGMCTAERMGDECRGNVHAESQFSTGCRQTVDSKVRNNLSEASPCDEVAGVQHMEGSNGFSKNEHGEAPHQSSEPSLEDVLVQTLDDKNISVSQVLATLLRSSQLETMEKVEVFQVKRLLHELTQRVSSL